MLTHSLEDALDRDTELELSGMQEFGKAQWQFFDDAVAKGRLEEPLKHPAHK